MSAHDPRTIHAAYERELAGFVESVRSGAAFDDQVTAERMSIRLVGALMSLLRSHSVDEYGRCSVCWRASGKWWRPWPHRSTCTVFSALGFSLWQPEWFVLSAVTDKAAAIRGSS